jgi:hypothetical protein
MLPRPASRPAGVALRVELLENRQLLSGASLRPLLQLLPVQGPQPLTSLLAPLQPTSLVGDSGIVPIDVPSLLPNLDLGSVGDLLLPDDGEGPPSTDPDQDGEAPEETGILGTVLQLGGELPVGHVANELGNLVDSVVEIGNGAPGEDSPTRGEGNGIGLPLSLSSPGDDLLARLEEHGTEPPGAGQPLPRAGTGEHAPGSDVTSELADLLSVAANQGPLPREAESPGSDPLPVQPISRPAVRDGLLGNGALRGAADLVDDREADEAAPASEPEAPRVDEGAQGEEAPADPDPALASAQPAGGLALVEGELEFVPLSTGVGQAEAAIVAGDVVFSGAGTEEANGAESDAIIAQPQEADQLAELEASDQAALEAALQQFLAQAGARDEEGLDLAGLEVPAYVAALAVGAAMFELRRRRRRKKQPSLALAADGSAPTITWLPGGVGEAL